MLHGLLETLAPPRPIRACAQRAGSTRHQMSLDDCTPHDMNTADYQKNRDIRYQGHTP